MEDMKIMLEVGMTDLTLNYNITGTHQMQTTYIQGKLNEYINGQGFNVPCKEADDIELFLHYLEQYIPYIWNYFKVFKKSNTEQQMP